ncbi:hypothetical protein [Rosenbergiella nectarea]|uniref:hypothetical protein n=1 Tax=Rosenbergiella nectarea TaxID=988801 RepID=UPI003528E39D
MSFREKVAYGMGDAGCNMIGGAIMLFLNYWSTMPAVTQLLKGIRFMIRIGILV